MLMAVEPKDVVMYVTEEGETPFENWLSALKDRKGRARVDVRLARVRLGNLGDHRTVGQGVSELRVDYGPGYRVYFGQVGTRVILLLCGGDKTSQQADIRRAQQYWADYKRRARKEKGEK
jgi:putative addiction module killer protein